jgi:hypothetical protein
MEGLTEVPAVAKQTRFAAQRQPGKVDSSTVEIHAWWPHDHLRNVHPCKGAGQVRAGLSCKCYQGWETSYAGTH